MDLHLSLRKIAQKGIQTGAPLLWQAVADHDDECEIRIALRLQPRQGDRFELCKARVHAFRGIKIGDTLCQRVMFHLKPTLSGIGKSTQPDDLHVCLPLLCPKCLARPVNLGQNLTSVWCHCNRGELLTRHPTPPICRSSTVRVNALKAVIRTEVVTIRSAKRPDPLETHRVVPAHRERRRFLRFADA